MVSGSHNVRHMTGKTSARSHQGRRTVGRGLLRTIQHTKVQGNPPSVSDTANPRIPSTQLLKQNESKFTPSRPARVKGVQIKTIRASHVSTTDGLCKIAFKAITLRNFPSSLSVLSGASVFSADLRQPVGSLKSDQFSLSFCDGDNPVSRCKESSSPSATSTMQCPPVCVGQLGRLSGSPASTPSPPPRLDHLGPRKTLRLTGFPDRGNLSPSTGSQNHTTTHLKGMIRATEVAKPDEDEADGFIQLAIRNEVGLFSNYYLLYTTLICLV
ncbi:unnamed protein product [Protopolystoma xenopodis]|uniref:Uncharacterized protein n=1 Tax=Protopolystoma xenopodis TaxID=117903 RepID=A0A448XF55_9PLAT|nr:unnamed protein product [Protopolystoma xenopodis]